MRIRPIQTGIGGLLGLILLLGSLHSAFSQEVKWLKVGSLHGWFREDGAEPEVGRTNLQSDQQDGLRWPAQFHGAPDNKVDNLAAKALWIGTANYTDAEQYGGVTYAHKVVHLGPRGWDTEREFIPIEFKLIGRFDHPQVLVDGLQGSDLQFNDKVDEIDPNLPADRMIYNVVNTSIGITMTRKVYAFTHPDHDDYFITDYIFKNTGNVDADEEIEQSKTLEDVNFFFQYRYATSREGAEMTGLNSPRWGINSMLSTRGEAKAEDGPQYGGDYEDWLNGNENADSLRCQFAWMGRHSQAPVDLIGAPDFKFETGRFMAPQFIGVATLHADKSATDKSDDPQQPTTTSYQQSDDPPTRPNDQFNPARMDEEWEWMTRGHRLPRHDEVVGDGFPDQLEQTPGGFSNTNGYGPYTLAPGDSIRIVVAEGVNGLDRQSCIDLGKQWIENSAPFTLPNASTTNDRDVFKNAWVLTGEDSLMKTFGLARRNFESGVQLPHPPPPPDFFEINSGGDRISLSWSNSAESWPGFAGYRVFRAVARPDTFYQEIFACGQGTGNPTIVNNFDDTSAQRGFDYYYYIASFDDGSNSNGRILQSSQFWTRTQEPANLKRQAGTELSQIRVVPNPYYRNARNRQFLGREDDIAFFNIPGECTIKIFTERGDLIRTIEHTDGSGDEFWNQTTEFGQIVVSGIYLAVIATPEGATHRLKFVILR
ncbi:fibronectin [candidate division KSB1 bacterium]|nr:fibronectin [candidate division KSB1 bacterium]NIR70109.1 fibronectin [candidate division KSB1 bacterium]NIS27534.1 fibronectin [candidate division KSB1 bacterium]NIT74385.1 fibronectin [candidate division KSB1 bacterium]NIU28252.1 fibronectin [candidate division KSB1 bacterium]